MLNDMKKLAFACLLSLAGGAQAQTETSPYQPGVTAEGAVYFLPKTVLRFVVQVEKTTFTPGDFCKYASRYLRLGDVRTRPGVGYRVTSISMDTYGEADKAKGYAVEFNPKSVAANIALADDGTLLAINAAPRRTEAPKPFRPAPRRPQPNPRSYLSEEVLAAYPELSCAGKPYVDSEFCPGNEQTFEFLEEVLTEVMELFPSEYIHIGGDEAGKGAWKSCPKCQARMKAEGIADVDGLQSYLVHRIERFLNDHGRRLLGWDEILDGGLAPNATVMSWRGAEGGLKAIRAGHDAIMTPGEYCYLDYAQDAPFTQPLSIGGYTPLRKVYSFEMSFPELTPEEQARLLGVQANLWTEYIPTPEHVEYMLYPRVLAIAEAGWSLPERRDYDDFRRRALGAIEWLREEGYNPFDLEHEYGERPESLEPKEHLARGKRVEYRTPWHKKYAAAGETTLTDGMIGGWTYGDRRWQGFLNSDVDVTVDLEEPTEVHYVGLTFMQSKGPYVWVPSEVEIYASQDGEHFERLTTVRNDISTECPDLLFKTFAYTGRTSARYLRCVARSNGTPGGWLFLDEIVVL